MNNQKETGTRQLCGRLVEALDSILDAINQSQDLTEEEKQKIAPIVVEYRDHVESVSRQVGVSPQDKSLLPSWNP